MKIKQIFIALSAIFIVACTSTSADSTTKTAAEAEMEEGNYED